MIHVNIYIDPLLKNEYLIICFKYTNIVEYIENSIVKCYKIIQ